MSNVTLRRFAALVATAGAAAGSWAIVAEAAGVHLGFQFPHAAASTLGAGRTIAVTVGAAILGWAALALAEHRLGRPRRSWVVAAATVFVASLALPLGFASTTAATVGMVAIHLAVAAVAIAGFAPTIAAHRLQGLPTAAPAGLAHRAA